MVQKRVLAFEGLPGVGKTTLINSLVAFFARKNKSTCVVSVDNWAGAASLAKLLQDPDTSNGTKKLLYLALRLQQSEIVCKERKNYDIILMDRTFFTSVVFETYGHDTPSLVTTWLNQYVSIVPDTVIFLDAPLEVILSRKVSRNTRGAGLAQRIFHGYQELAIQHSWEIINADQSREAVFQETLARLNLAQ